MPDDHRENAGDQRKHPGAADPEARSPFTIFSDGFSDSDAAELYDAVCAWDVTETGHPENRYVSALVAAAESVLDVGCGTGSMLHHARESGHTGRLAGIDPDPSMLARATARPDLDIEWAAGTAADIAWRGEFDLATMNSNAFQCLTTDEDVRRSLAAVRAALRPGGRFAFGTRHVQDRAWERWTPDRAYDVTLPDGRELRQWHEVHSVTETAGGVVIDFSETTALPDGTVQHVGRSPLRFWDVPGLASVLTAAGFEVAEQYGTWGRGPVTGQSREIITVARAI